MSTTRRPAKNGKKKKRVKSKDSLYSNTLKSQQKRLRETLAFLDRIEVKDDGKKRYYPGTLTDEQFKFLGIQLFDLDLKTGETSPSVTQYFLPAKERWTLSDSASPIDDNFTEYNKSNTKRICRDSGWSKYLASAFCNHAESQEHNVLASPWKQLILHPKRGRLYHISQSLDVKSGTEYGGERYPHRTVLAVVDRDTHSCLPSVAELMVLISWMLAAMRYQETARTEQRRKNKATMRLHVIFPTLVYSFLRPARARVLYGYFENNTLKVVATKAHDFDVPNYAERMDCLVRWATPKIQGNTQMDESLSTIEEDTEDESL